MEGLRIVSQPEKGALLISHPSLDSWFKRAAVLLCQYDPLLGAYGWVGGELESGVCSSCCASQHCTALPELHACMHVELGVELG